MKKHYYYLLVDKEDRRHTDCMIVKAYNKADIRKHGYNVDNVQGRYWHYNEAKKIALTLATCDSFTGEPFINYTSLTGIDFVD